MPAYVMYNKVYWIIYKYLHADQTTKEIVHASVAYYIYSLHTKFINLQVRITSII